MCWVLYQALGGATRACHGALVDEELVEDWYCYPDSPWGLQRAS